MRMTQDEKAAQKSIVDLLNKSGYRTYGNILSSCVLKLTEEPDVVAYMIAESFSSSSPLTIVINRGLTKSQVSPIVRHEILHWWFRHHDRMIRHIAKKKGLNSKNLTNQEKADILKEIYSDDIANIAGDLDISNKGYTDMDKIILKNLELNGQTVSGLVTDVDFPDWTDNDMETMYDKIKTQIAELKKIEENQPIDDALEYYETNPRFNQYDIVYGEFVDENTFVDDEGNVVELK